MKTNKKKVKRKQWLVWVGYHDPAIVKYGKAYQVLEITDYEYERPYQVTRLSKRIKFLGEGKCEDYACRKSFVTRTEYARMAKSTKRLRRNPNLQLRVES